MADLLKLAQERRDAMARELRELDSFISMARYLASSATAGSAGPDDTHSIEAIPVEAMPAEATPKNAMPAPDAQAQPARRDAARAPEMDAAVFWKSFFRTPDAREDPSSASAAATV